MSQINLPPSKPITFARNSEGRLTVNRYFEYIDVSTYFLVPPSEVLSVELHFKCANGEATYIIVGERTEGILTARRVEPVGYDR